METARHRLAWVPRQHGTWAMLIAPVLTGGILAGFRWPQVLLLVTWIAAYLAFMAIRGWLGPHRGRYTTPALVWTVLAAAGVAVLVAWRPAITWWALPLTVLFGTSLLLIRAGLERTVPNDAIMIGASCLMAAMAATSRGLSRAVGPSAFLNSVALPWAWLVAAIFAGYFWGTIPYVKTMIRERGKWGWYAASVIYHLALVVPAFLINPWLGGLSLVILLRAAAVPRLWPHAKPKWIGLGEVAVTVLLVIIVCLTIS